MVAPRLWTRRRYPGPGRPPCAPRDLRYPKMRESWVATTSARPFTSPGASQQVDHLGAGFVVEITGRFIAQDQRRVARKGARDGDPLLLSAAELRRQRVQAFAETDDVEHLLRPLTRLSTRRPADQERHGDIVLRGERGQQVESLENESEDSPRNRARSRRPMTPGSRPMTAQSPASRSSIAPMMDSKVVLPQPDGPTSNSNSPSKTSRSTPRSAATVASPAPNDFVTPRQRTIARDGDDDITHSGPARSIAPRYRCG